MSSSVYGPSNLDSPDWKQIVKRVAKRVLEDNLSMQAAGVAFYAMLAVFPALGAIVTLYALVFDPADVQKHLQYMTVVMPADVISIFDEQLSTLVNVEQQSMSIGLIGGVLFAIWSAHRGVNALVYAITGAYKESETRNFFVFNTITFLMTFGAIALIVVTLAVLVLLPNVIRFFPLPEWSAWVSRAAGIAIFMSLTIGALATLYRFAPPRRPAKWRWLSSGALTATLVWMIVSIGFSVYVTYFDTYNETYGTLGAIMVLLMWFFLSSFAVLLGATLNAEMEHQTRRDTTIGEELPMGERDAVVADSVPKNR